MLNATVSLVSLFCSLHTTTYFFKTLRTLLETPHWTQCSMGLGQPFPRTLIPSSSERRISTTGIKQIKFINQMILIYECLYLFVCFDRISLLGLPTMIKQGICVIYKHKVPPKSQKRCSPSTLHHHSILPTNPNSGINFGNQ